MTSGKVNIQEMLFRNRKYAILFLIIFFAVGTAGTIFIPSRELFFRLFPLALLLSFAGLLIFSRNKPEIRSVIAVIAVTVAGFLIEAAGVNTGKIFGKYTYGGTLGIKLLDTPLIIGINWAMLVFATASISERIKIHPAFKAVVSSAVMVIYDLLLEQIAGILDMWHWENNIVPVRNYIAWFLIALTLHSMVRISRIKTGYYLAIPVILCQMFFFLILTIYFNFAS